MSPSHDIVRAAVAATSGAPRPGIAFIYPIHRRPEHDGWTAGLQLPTGIPAPDPVALAAALGRPTSAVRAEAVGACLFLTIFDAA